MTGTVANATFATSASTATTATTAGTVTTAAQGNITSVGILTNVSVAGNITGGTFYGNGAGLSNINAGNITGAYGNANVAAYLPTNTANLGANNVTFTGNLVVGQDLVVNGNLQYTNVDTFTVEDPVIELGRGANNTPLTTNDGKDRGTQLWYYTSAEKSAFMGYDNSSAEMALAANVSIANNVVTYNDYGTTRVGNLTGATASLTGNVTGNYFLGNGSQLTGLPAAYGNSNVAAFMANYGANTISLNGNISIGNTTGQQNNTQSLKFLTSNATQTMSIGTANATAFTIDVTNSTGNEYAELLITRKRIDLYVENDLSYGNAFWAGHQANIGNAAAPYFRIYAQSNTAGGGEWNFYGSNAAMTAPGNITTTGNLNAVGLSLSGNVLSAINSVANITTTGNITGGYVNANGSLLTNLTAGNIVGTVATAQTATTVTGNAQANITSVGILSSLSVSGNVNANGFTANSAGITIGNVPIWQTNISPSTLQIGPATGFDTVTTNGKISAVGNVVGGNIYTAGLISAAGTVTGGNLYTAGTITGGGGNAAIYTTGDISLAGNIVTLGPINLGGNLTGSNATAGIKITNYKDSYYNISQDGTGSGTITPNIALGSLQSITLTGNITLNNFGGTPQDGQSLLIRFIQDATGSRLLTSTMKWSGGAKTLTTAAGGVDIASIVLINGTYYASLTNAYA